MNFKEAIDKAKEGSKKRKFKQSIDLALSLKHIDLKKSENKFSEEVVLPNGRGKAIKIGVFASPELVERLKEADVSVIPSGTIEALGKDTRKARKLIAGHEFFLAEPVSMPLIAKAIGKFIGPKGKMPKPLPPGADPKPLLERLKKSVRVRLREQPTIHATIGAEDMDTDKLAANAEAVMTVIKRRLSKGDDNIAHVFVKTTMGPAVRVK